MFNQTSALPGTVMSITHLSPHEIFLRPPSDGQQHTVVKDSGVKGELGGLGQIVAPRELQINRPRAPVCSQWLTPLGLAQNPETVASGHLRS